MVAAICIANGLVNLTAQLKASWDWNHLKIIGFLGFLLGSLSGMFGVIRQVTSLL